MSKKLKLSATAKSGSGKNSHHRTKEQLFQIVGAAKVEELKKYSASIDFLNDRIDESGDTYLHRIASDCNGLFDFVHYEPMARYLLSQEPRLTRAKNLHGQTALSLACTKATCLPFIKFVITLDPECANIVDAQEMTPLQQFITNIKLYEHTESFYFTPNENKRRFRYDELFANESVKLIEYFLEIHCDLNKVDSSGRNTLFCAILKGDNSKYLEFSDTISIMLLKNGAEFVSSKRSHIFHFVYQFSLDLLKCIVQYQPHYLHEVDSDGWTLLHHILALKNKNCEATYLLKNGATIKKENEILHLAAKSGYNSEIIEMLLDKYSPKNVNKKGSHGSTLLIKCATNITIVNKLLELGADPNVINKNGKTALHTAIDHKNIEGFKKLLSVMKYPIEPTDESKKEKGSLQLEEISLYKFLISNIQCDDHKTWFHILEYILKMSKFQNTTLSNTLVTFYTVLINDLFLFFICTNNSDVVIQSLKMIINANKSVISMLCKIRLFENSETYIYTGSIGEIIKYRNMNNDIGTYKQLYDFIQIMFKIGFSVSQTPENCVTALTILFLYRSIDTGLSDIKLRTLTKLLIDNGVKVESMALTKYTDYFEQNYRLNSSIVIIENYFPDALILSFLDDKRECTKLMLPFWWGPPLALVALHIGYCERLDDQKKCHKKSPKYRTIFNIIHFLLYWLPYLITFARIPHGSKLYQEVEEAMLEWHSSCYFRDRANNELIQELIAFLQNYKELNRTVPSLQDLCRFKVRQMLAESAVIGDCSLPELVQQVLPYDLPDM